ncbi:unnamed protein product [Triticum turgidum subsp. durum]|uniref:Uncharacterized protein n=1 Tax=Triticum turgidum subsp. durum TaxID=4567 RepID=A0A9R0R4R0_TRITD|nr:unnamed protein product [Triticum turgidum subsp. durum]
MAATLVRASGGIGPPTPARSSYFSSHCSLLSPLAAISNASSHAYAFAFFCFCLLACYALEVVWPCLHHRPLIRMHVPAVHASITGKLKRHERTKQKFCVDDSCIWQWHTRWLMKPLGRKALSLPC